LADIGLTKRSRGTRQETAAPLRSGVEAVEKVPKQILGRDAEKSDLIECATINDLMGGRVKETPENIVLTRQKDFSYRLVILDFNRKCSDHTGSLSSPFVGVIRTHFPEDSFPKSIIDNIHS
jgi:hypothetical protein